MVAEVLLAAIAEPDAQDVRHALALVGREGLVQRDRLRALGPAGGVAMRVPQRARPANEHANIFDAFSARGWFLIGALLRRHVACKRTECSLTQRAPSERRGERFAVQNRSEKPNNGPCWMTSHVNSLLSSPVV